MQAPHAVIAPASLGGSTCDPVLRRKRSLPVSRYGGRRRPLSPRGSWGHHAARAHRYCLGCACGPLSLARYVAFWLQLDNGYWAGTSAAIVCQPQLGASLRKGWYRMVGTLIGAV